MKLRTNSWLYRIGVGIIVIALFTGVIPSPIFLNIAKASSTIQAGKGPHAIAVNPVTGRIYMANAFSDNVTVLEDSEEGMSLIATIEVGTTPNAIALNPVTNKIYVANADSHNVTVIDGATNHVSTVEAGQTPFALAVNATTNKVYIANLGSNTVTVIDGATNSSQTETVLVGESPFAVAVNEATNKIYVANVDSDNVTVIDGSTGTTLTVPAGTGPNALAVSPITGSVYVANFFSNNVTVIDGTTGGISTAEVGIAPVSVAIHGVTGSVYVVNTGSNNVTILDREDLNHPITVSTGQGSGPTGLAINEHTNRVYIANYDSNSVTVLDGSNHEISTVSAGENPVAVAVNSKLNKIYVANFNGDNMTVWAEGRALDADLSSLTVSEGTLSPAFAPEVSVYAMNVGYSASSISVTAVTYNPLTTLMINDQPQGSGVPLRVDLRVGSNIINITVMAEDGLSIRRYTLTVTRNGPSAPTPNDKSEPGFNPTESLDPAGVTEESDGVLLGSDAATVTTQTKANGKTAVEVLLRTDSLMKALEVIKGKQLNAQTIRLPVSGTDAIRTVGIPAKVFVAGKTARPNAVLLIEAMNAVYNLPLNFPELVSFLQLLGDDWEDAIVYVTMETITGAAAEQIRGQALAEGITLAGDILEFTIMVKKGGSEQLFSDFGNKYITRSLVIHDLLDPAQATAVRIDPLTGKLSFVPSLFKMNNGITKVNIFRTGSSLYAVAQSKKTFADLQQHWSRADVELLASKLIVQGTSDSTFAPELKITRAQFVSLIVRALGLEEVLLNEENSGNFGKFTDVRGSDWFAGAVEAAEKAQLVSGFEDGTFRPNETITREQMAVVVSHVLTYAGQQAAVADKLNPLLTGYEDKAAISSWARVAVAQVINSGIMTGLTDSTFVPQSMATRAQAVVVIKRILQGAGYIN
ncbi:S-layer homology domain-containing protein [Paenibacillus eucommiae]|uniref:YVTN family beta-propeller protein n=1 Tax=Paenibacillus eucommiae TaxID=1355755 RepID=A0ABS4IMQ1_9BACL|nr:S-layer homology domain-containing protein [Paenibacillus eucommiae]MBP1988857.1 YVTN family beta-propeller protein [Paenibacillus eucommiae]